MADDEDVVEDILTEGRAWLELNTTNRFIRGKRAVIDSHIHINSGRCAPLPLLWNAIRPAAQPVFEFLIPAFAKVPFKDEIMHHFFTPARRSKGLPDILGELPFATLENTISKLAVGPADQFQHKPTHEIAEIVFAKNRATYRLGYFREAATTPFYTPMFALPMDMDYAHLDGYEGRAIYYYEVKEDAPLLWWTKKKNTYRKKYYVNLRLSAQKGDVRKIGLERKDKAGEVTRKGKVLETLAGESVILSDYGDDASFDSVGEDATIIEDVLLHENWDQQVQRTIKAAVKHPFEILPFYHYDPRRWCNPESDYLRELEQNQQWAKMLAERRGAVPFVARRPESTKCSLKEHWLKPLRDIDYRVKDPSKKIGGVASPNMHGVFVGIKMYTALGYKPDDPHLKGIDNLRPTNESDSSDMSFYGRCQENNIPIIVHCQPGGMLTHDAVFYQDHDDDRSQGTTMAGRAASKVLSSVVKEQLEILASAAVGNALPGKHVHGLLKDGLARAAAEHASKLVSKKDTKDAVAETYNIFANGFIDEVTASASASIATWDATDLEKMAANLAYREGLKKLLVAPIKDGETEETPLSYFQDHYIHPKNWVPVLKNCPRLRLCLAHFGGQEGWGADFTGTEVGCDGKKGWVPTIVDMMWRNEHVYADLSYHDLQFLPEYWLDLPDGEGIQPTFPKSAGGYTRAAKRLAAFLKANIASPILKKILFGTDWYMTILQKGALSDMVLARESEITYKEYCTSSKTFLDEVNPRLWPLFTFVNPLRFLGLLDDDGPARIHKLHVGLERAGAEPYLLAEGKKKLERAIHYAKKLDDDMAHTFFPDSLPVAPEFPK